MFLLRVGVSLITFSIACFRSLTLFSHLCPLNMSRRFPYSPNEVFSFGTPFQYLSGTTRPWSGVISSVPVGGSSVLAVLAAFKRIKIGDGMAVLTVSMTGFGGFLVPGGRR